jgi:hypothetical protein
MIIKIIKNQSNQCTGFLEVRSQISEVRRLFAVIREDIYPQNPIMIPDNEIM